MNLSRDGWVLALLAVMTVLLIAAVSGSYQLFGYALVAFLGILAARGFVERERVTWVPPIVATLVLLIAFSGMFRFEAVPVNSAADTWLGFQRGTAFLIYGIWIPAFFTMGLAFTLVFHHLKDHE